MTEMSVTTTPPTATSTTGSRRRRRTRGSRRSTMLTVLVWLAVAYFLLPLVWLMFSATKSNTDLFTSFGLWFGSEFSLFDNLETLFTIRNGIFARWLLNTVFYAGVSAIGATALAVMAGYAFAKYPFPGRSGLFAAMLGTIMIPMTALAIPTYLIFSSFGITDTPLAVIIPSLVSPFGVYLIRVYAAEAVPDELIEAGRIDGAGEFRIFRQISLRLLGPGAITVFLFAVVGTWNNYFLPLVMINTTSLYPVTVGLAQLQAQSTGGGGTQALFSTVLTGSLVSIIPLVIAFLFLQRYWQVGLATGGVKG